MNIQKNMSETLKLNVVRWSEPTSDNYYWGNLMIPKIFDGKLSGWLNNKRYNVV